jgi:hypothetical protein
MGRIELRSRRSRYGARWPDVSVRAVVLSARRDLLDGRLPNAADGLVGRDQIDHEGLIALPSESSLVYCATLGIQHGEVVPQPAHGEVPREQYREPVLLDRNGGRLAPAPLRA